MANYRTTADDYLLAYAMLTSNTQAEAAEKAGVTTRALSKRIQTNEYKKVLAETRREVFQLTTSKLVQASAQAVDVLTKHLTDKNPYVQYNAASKILQLAGDNVDREEIIERLNRIEEKQAEQEEEC